MDITTTSENQIKQLFRGPKETPGITELHWEPENIAQGNYLIRIKFGNNYQSSRVLYITKSAE